MPRNKRRSHIDGKRKADAMELTTRTFQCRMASVDEEKRSIEAVIATEQPVSVVEYGWDSYRIVDEVLRMDGVKLPSQVPLLDSHSRWGTGSVLGSTRELRIEQTPEGPVLVGRNFFSSLANDEWTKVREGHLTDNSVGYRVTEFEDVKPGETKTIKGRTYTAGKRTLRISTRWEVKENSICPIGADALAKMREETYRPGLAGRSSKENRMSFEQWLRSRGIDPATLTDAWRDELKKEFEAFSRGETPEPSNGPAPTPSPTKPAEAAPSQRTPEEIASDAIRQERERTVAIRKEGTECRIPAAVIDQAIGEGKSIDQARAMFLQAIREEREGSVGTAATNMHVKERVLDQQILTTAILMRAGWDDRHLVDKKASESVRSEQVKLLEQADEYRGISLMDVCRRACELEGIRAPWGADELMRRAFTTVSLPSIFSAAANKSMLRGYEETPNTSLQWCGTKDVNDFKANKRGRLGDVPDLKALNDAGEIEHGKLAEWFESYSIATFAELFALTRVDIINDDMGALTELPMKMGAAGRRLIDNKVYTHLLANGNLNDSVALFATSRTPPNYFTGAGTTLQSSQLTVARKMLRVMTDLQGSPLNIEGRFLLVPPELETTAQQLVRSIADPNASQSGVANVWGSLIPIVEPRLSASTYTGYSTTAWFLLASPMQANTVEIGFLRGQRAPTLERLDTAPNVLGVQWRVYFDIGVKALDFRGMIKSKGAA